jgi:2-polyprenyl-3-methyl-5-hydroxy-6-metoxy-1,4-benzoquinol methylase
MFSTTEITSHEESSDNVIHQRLYFAYVEAAKILKTQPGAKVLEIGCGAGRGMQLIAESCSDYTGIDKNERLLELHKQTYPNFNFIVRNIPPMSFLESDTFDFVISFQVIEHIENDKLFLEEISRVLKPGGKAIITTPNKSMSLTRNPWHVREYLANELEALSKPFFSKVSIQGVLGSEPVMQYYKENKKSVEKITRLDIFNLQYRLPRQILQFPYDLLNRLNRKSLEKGNDTLVEGITVQDYFLTTNAKEGFDFFCEMDK